VEQLDSQLRRLHASAETLYSLRRQLATSTGQVARSLSALASAEEHRGLGVALAALADVQDRVERVHGEEQAAADFFLLAELIKDYVGLVAAVKDVFQVRTLFCSRLRFSRLAKIIKV
jgi:sorting nexin-1/2